MTSFYKLFGLAVFVMGLSIPVSGNGRLTSTDPEVTSLPGSIGLPIAHIGGACGGQTGATAFTSGNSPELLICQSGSWEHGYTDSRYGGAYAEHSGWSANPQTGGRNCPPGFTASYMGYNYMDGSGKPSKFFICQR